jgi:hypothetical protein
MFGAKAERTDYVVSRPDGARWKVWLQTHRIELNAMSPRQMIEWLDEHVESHGELKLVSPPEVAEDRLHHSLVAVIEAQVAERVLYEARERIREAVQRRLAVARAILPEGDGLADGIRERVERERETHWSEIVDLFAKETAKQTAEEDALWDEVHSARDSTKH